MNKTVFAFIRAMFLIWITTACIMGLALDKEIIYAITLVAYLCVFVSAEVRAADLERRLKKYIKAYNKLAKRFEEENDENNEE